MKFIYADSLDFVNPNYDFQTDSHHAKREVYWDDKFSHEMLEPAPYDGLLVSRAIVGGYGGAGKYTESQSMRIKRVGAREFLRFGGEKFKGKWLMGDNGAFSYHKLEKPPYSIDDTLEFYLDCGFTHGFSLDHVIFEFKNNTQDMSGGSDTAQERFAITQENALKFLNASTNMPDPFQPIGVVQGWSPHSMAVAARSLVDMGYKFIAIGGMVPLKVHDIHSILTSIRSQVPQSEGISMHLLGFAKADHLHDFNPYGITSFDSTSPMLRAFKDDKNNYFYLGENGRIEYCSAIRIPQANENIRLRNHVKTGLYEQERLVAMEASALQMIRKYDKGAATISDTLDAILEYSVPLVDNGTMEPDRLRGLLDKKRSLYQKTLERRPWEKCPCAICKHAGIETVIFRASNRNKRRGMHNLAVFYDYLGRLNQENE